MDERDVLTVTTFEKSEHDGQWYWHTQTGNQEVVGDGAEGYTQLSGAAHGFFVQQGVNYEEAQLNSDYSQLNKISENKYTITKYTKKDN